MEENNSEDVDKSQDSYESQDSYGESQETQLKWQKSKLILIFVPKFVDIFKDQFETTSDSECIWKKDLNEEDLSRLFEEKGKSDFIYCKKKR